MALRHCLCAVLLAVSAGASFASDTPPIKLHLVGDHWTAWSPPTDLAADAEIHIVEKGDTLWALAGKHLGNPYLWPQIWENNQYVLDAHWIYPGDPLVVGIAVAPAETVGALAPIEEVTESAGAEAEPAAAPSRAERRRSAAETRRNTPVPIGSEDDIYCTGYVGDLEESFTGEIVGSEFDDLTPRLNAAQDWVPTSGVFGIVKTLKYELSQGDIVYLDGGHEAGMSAGMLFTSIEPRGKVRHPISGHAVGRFYAYTGRVRVLTVLDNRAIAEIVHTCAGMHVGSHLRPFRAQPIPLARPPLARPINDPTTADLGEAPVILHADSSLFTLGQDNVVFIDRGEGDNVFPGDLFTIYRPSLHGRLPVPVGELGVLSVQAHTAVARILESRYPIYVGDRLEQR